MIEIRRLATILIGISIACVATALATHKWQCGSLFHGCQYGYKKNTIISISALLITGIVCLAIAFLIDLFGFYSSKFSSATNYVLIRLVLLLLGSFCIIIGLIVYVSYIDGTWSFFIATIGGVFAMQAVALAIITSNCVVLQVRRVFVRTT